MKATSFARRFWVAATAFALSLPGLRAQEQENPSPAGDPPPFEVPDVSEADFPFPPPADFAGFVPIHQLEMEEHPDGQTAAQRRRALRAVPKKSVIRPRAITAGARVLGWHPYWAEEGDYLSYDYSNLTHIAYFSAEVGTSGTISSIHGWNTDPVVELAHANGVKVILTATLFGESSNHALLTNSAACRKLATNLVQKVTARGGDGICIDFESVGSWSGATKALTSFMSNLVTAARASGTNLEVSICLPSVDWYADFAVGEYEKIGVDYSIIMGYDYYYAGSATPGPVAPLYSSAQWQGASSWCSVDYSTRYYLNKMTNAAHLMLAVPYYGRRWKAATTNIGAKSAGSSYSAAVTYPNAAANAETYGRKWDSNGSVPYYTYKSGTNAYQCFYDDTESLGLKYDYAKSKGLGGIGIWCLTHAPESEELWTLLGDELGNYTPPGVTIPSTSPGPAAIATGINADSALLSWTPATEDPSGYVVQSAPSAEGLANGYWVNVPLVFSNTFSTADGWVTNNVARYTTNTVTVNGQKWEISALQVRPGLTSYQDPGYVYMTYSNAIVRTPPVLGTITQVAVRVRSAGDSSLTGRYCRVQSAPAGGTSTNWTTLGYYAVSSYSNILDYAASCNLSNPAGTLFRVENTTVNGSGTTIVLHEIVVTGTTTNWIAAPGATVTDTCATNLTSLSAPTYYRVRNASSTNWSDIVAVLPGMIPSGLAAEPAATNISLSWTAAPGAAAYQVDVASGPYTNWTSTCPATSLGTNQFLSGQSWCYTGTVNSVTTSVNLAKGPAYCSVAKYAGHYLAGYPGQALQSYDFPLYGATSANLSFSNCPWNAKNATCGITTSVLRVYYRLDQGPWNFIGECRASSVTDEVWSAQSYDLPYLDGETLAVKIVAPYAERHADSLGGSIRGAGLKNVKLSFSGTTGRYCDANRPEGYPKTVTSPSDLLEGLSPETPYWIRVQALTENTRSVWVETTATTAEDTGGDQPSAEDTPVTTTWDFTVPEGWSLCDDDLYTGETNVNGRAWTLGNCYVRPTDDTTGDIGYVYLYKPTNSYAITPAFAGVVTQVTTLFRPASSNVTRQASLYASTDGGATFSLVGDCPVPLKQTYTNTFAFNPPLDGGDHGVIFCASNSGTAGSIQWRRLTIEGTSTAPEEPDADSYSPFGTSTAEQPHGALSGIVLYLSAGHGFTANGKTNAWAAGRGLTYGMVEDMGTIDQLNYFALQAWKAGATIVPMRPLGHQTNEVIIDNVDTAASLASRVTYGGNWGDTSQTDYYYGNAGEVGYRWANTCATGTTAWASYRPDLPAAGEYPVYVWARPGSDRVPQLYRVHHAGGVTDVRVDHRQVGNGWVWLGNFWFDAGTNGCVNISNYAPGFPNRTIIADAVRFGNGMGDISRGTAGISGYERELEGARYWVQRMVMDSQGLSATIYHAAGGPDQDDNVSAPNRMAYAMCRTAADDDGWTPERWRRLYLSFHSNASGTQRGCMGLYDTRVTGSYLAGQTNLARCIANSIVSNMTLAHARGVVATAWQQDCARVLGSHYGEIYGGSIYAKMDNTIAEVAFHDKELDAAIMKSATGREWLARSALRGILRHFVTRYASDSNLTVTETYAPDAPISVAATNSGLNCVTVSWKMPHGTNQLSHDHTGFVVYVSTNGYAFGNPVAISSGADEYAHKFTDLPTGTPYYFRVCATNLGGESLSSPVAGAALSDDGSTADVLVVDGFKRNDGSLSPTRYFANNLNGNVTLVRPKMINSFDYVKEHGNAIAAAGKSFDFMDATRVTSTDLARYPKVVWCLGTESTADETFSYEEQQLLATYLANHGALFVSGSEIGWDLDYKGSAADKAFFNDWLHCAYVADAAATNAVRGKSSTYFSSLSLAFNRTNALDDIYAAKYPDILAPAPGSEAFVAAVYGTASSTNGAIIACSNSICRTVVMGFPFETVTDATQRNKLMKKVLDFFEENTTPPAWIGDTAYTTGLGGEVPIDLKTQVTGYPSPAVTLTATFDDRTGEAVDESAYIVAEDGFIFLASPDAGIGEGTYRFTFLASNGTGGDIYQDVIITVGNSPIWQAIPDILVDLDADTTVNLYRYVSGDPIPDLALDTNRTAAAAATYEFDADEGFLVIGPASAPTTNIFTFTASNAYGTASVTFTNAIRRLDTDDDGIPDWWAIQHFGGATSCNPNLDPDGDGYTNYQEYILGTDPNDPSSYFALQAISGDEDGETWLYWPSATGLTYTIYTSTNLLGGFESFTPAFTNLPADPPDNILPVTPSNPATFYRLEAD